MTSSETSPRAPRRAILAGIGGGVVSALLLESVAIQGPGLGALLLPLAPLPSLLVGLGWGLAAALTATVCGTVAMAGTGPGAIAEFVLAIGLPSALVAHLATLARYDGQDRLTHWFPSGRILWALALYGAALPVFALLGLDQAEMQRALRAFVLSFAASMPPESTWHHLSGDRLDRVVVACMAATPAAIAAYWTVIVAIDVYLAGKLAVLFGLLVRPWPDLHWLSLPKVASLAFGIALAALAIPGPPRVLATGALGALTAAFLIEGTAVVHATARARTGGTGLIALLYSALVLFSGLAVPMVALLGLAETVLGIRRRTLPPPVALPLGSV